MKTFTIITAAALALMVAVPFTARAQEWRAPAYACNLRHRDIVWDRHNLHRQMRDIRHDRFELRREVANGNWRAAQGQRNDLRHDYLAAHAQRWDLRRDYQGRPGPGYVAPMGVVPPANFAYLQ
jgi:hypothetical protein